MSQQLSNLARETLPAADAKQLSSPVETFSSSTALHITSGPPVIKRSTLTLPVATLTSMEAANTMDISMDHAEGTDTAHAVQASVAPSMHMETEEPTPPTSANSFAAGQQVVKQEGDAQAGSAIGIATCGAILPTGLQVGDGPTSGPTVTGPPNTCVDGNTPQQGGSQRSGSCGDETRHLVTPDGQCAAAGTPHTTAGDTPGGPDQAMHMQEDEGAWEPEGRPQEDPDTEDGGEPGDEVPVSVAGIGPSAGMLVAGEVLGGLTWPAMPPGQQLPGVFGSFGTMAAPNLALSMSLPMGTAALTQPRGRPAGSIYGHYRSKKVQLSPARLLHIPRNLIEESLDIETILGQGISIEIEADGVVQPPNITASVAVYKNSTGHSYYRILGFKPVCRQYQGWMLDCWKAVDALTVRMCISWPGEVPAPEIGHADMSLSRHLSNMPPTDLRSTTANHNSINAAVAAAAAAKQKRGRTQLTSLANIAHGGFSHSTGMLGAPSSADTALMMMSEGPPSKVHSSTLRLSAGLLSDPGAMRGPPTGSLVNWAAQQQQQQQVLNMSHAGPSSIMPSSNGTIMGLGESIPRGVTQVVDADGQVWTLSPSNLQLSSATNPGSSSTQEPARQRSGLVLGSGLENTGASGPDSGGLPRWDQLHTRLPHLMLSDRQGAGPNSGSTPSTTTQVLMTAGQGNSTTSGTSAAAPGSGQQQSSNGMMQVILPNGQQMMVGETPPNSQLRAPSSGPVQQQQQQQQQQAQSQQQALLSALGQSGLVLQGLPHGLSLGTYSAPSSGPMSAPASGMMMGGIASGGSLGGMHLMQDLSQQYNMMNHQQQAQQKQQEGEQKPSLVQAMLTTANGTENVLLMQTPQGLMVLPANQVPPASQPTPAQQLSMFLRQHSQQHQHLSLGNMGTGPPGSGGLQQTRLSGGLAGMSLQTAQPGNPQQQQQQQQVVMLSVGQSSSSFQTQDQSSTLSNRASTNGTDSSIHNLINGITAAGMGTAFAYPSAPLSSQGNDAGNAQQQPQQQQQQQQQQPQQQNPSPPGSGHLQQQQQQQQHLNLSSMGQQIMYTILPSGLVQTGPQQLVLSSGPGGTLSISNNNNNINNQQAPGSGGLVLGSGPAPLDLSQQLSMLQQQVIMQQTMQQQQQQTNTRQ